MSLRDRAQPLEESIQWGNQTRVSHDGLDEHAGDLSASGREELLYRGQVVEGQHRRMGRRRLGNAGRVGEAQCRHAAPRGHQEGVGVAVVASGELEDDVPSGGGPGQAEGAHGGLRATVHQAHHLDPGHQAHDSLRQLDFGGRRGSVRGAAVELVGQRFNDHGMGVSQDEGPPAQDVVRVATALGVEQVRALPAFHEERRAPDRAEGPDRRVHAPGDQLLGALPERV